MRQFNYNETKQVILADIFNILKDKGYNTNEPIRIPEEMEGQTITLGIYDKYSDCSFNLSMKVDELNTNERETEIIGSMADSGEYAEYSTIELGLDSLVNVLDFVEDMPEAKDATYNEEEE